DFKVGPRKIKNGIIVFLAVAAISYSFLFKYIINNDFLTRLLSSERDLNVGGEISLSTFSSGRTNIWNSYINNFDPFDLLFGYGGINLDIGFSLHNDFLEVFFFYGILAFLVFVVIVYNIYLKKG